MKKTNTKPLLFLVLSLSILLLLPSVFALNVNFVSPTPSNASTVNTRNVIINATIDTENPLSSIIYNWNNTNYSIYDDSLVLYYNFDNRSSLGENDTHVKDISRYGNNGTIYRNNTLSNVTLINGKYGTAYQFYGNDKDRITFSSIKLTNNWTISFWINIPNITTETNIISSSDFKSRIMISPLSKLQLESDTNGINLLTGGTVISNNSWQNIVITKRGNVTISYINGVLNEQKEISTLENLTLTDIGNPSGSTARYFNGSIDDLIIINNTLSSNDISRLYNRQISKFNNTQYRIYYNSSELNGINYNLFSLLANDSTNNINLSSLSLRILSSINITNNFFNTIRSDFYGINLGSFLFWDKTQIAPDGDNVFDGYTNTTWNRDKVKDLNIKTIRVDMHLHQMSAYNGTDILMNGTSPSINITTQQEMVRIAKEEGYKISFIADYMPEWLANKTTGWCNSTYTWKTCSPYNYTLFENLVYKFLQEVQCTGNSCQVECLNEPEQTSFWLNNLSMSDITKPVEYVKLCNATYQAVQRWNSSIETFGPGTHVIGTTENQFLSTFMSNLSYINNGKLGISFHYVSTEYSANTIYTTLDSLCTTYNFNCSTMFSSEWKHKNSTEQNTTIYQNKWTKNMAQQIHETLNYAPQRIKQSYYKFGNQEKYNVNDEEYPLIAKMASEPSLDNTFYPSYYVIYNFARYAPALGTVYNLTIDTDEFIATWTKEVTTNKYSLTLTNKINDKQNITLNCNTFNGNLIDVSSGELYSCASGSVNLGVTDEFEVRYLTEFETSLSNGIWYFVNYLGEIISAMTDEQVQQYVEGYQINEICAESDLTFLGATAIAGILLTIILVGGVITILLMSFNGVIDIDKIRGISLEEVVGGILIVGLVFLTIATMAFLIGGNYCPAIQ